MAIPKPTVYLLYGDDELAMADFVARLREKLGDPSTADLNTIRFAAESTELGALAAACGSAPFLAPRRLVILDRPAVFLGSDAVRERLFSLLDSLPPTTALVLVQPGDLKSTSPLRAWAEAHAGTALCRAFDAPHDKAFLDWLRQRAQSLGGSIEPQAAHLLAELVSEDSRLASLELAKLLDYVDRRRPIAVEDVETLTPFRGQGDVFAMVDAIGNRNGREALLRLHRLLEEEDPHPVFGMIVRQFRLIIQARECLERGADPRQVLGVHPFVAEKVGAQARNFSLHALEDIYHQLLDLDLASKSSSTSLDTSLDTLVASLSR
jgi:DNA polymerase-3 subunit delta